MLRFGTYWEPSKASLREMLAEAFRNTEAKKAAAVAPPIAAEAIDESALEELALALIEAVPQPEAHYDQPAPTKPKTIVHSVYGEETESEWVARLEHARRMQEEIWFRAGRSREQIIDMMRGWPKNCGYPPYTWAIGYPRPEWVPRYAR